MKIFLDTADYKKIAEHALTGLIDGVTINPTLLKIQREEPIKIVQEIIKVLPDAEISLQVTEQDPRRVYEQAVHIANLADNMLVKVPCYAPYVPVIHRLIQEDIPVNVTLVFSLTQALAMAQLGVNYISLFVGRLDDHKRNGLAVATEVQHMLDHYNFESDLLVASVRNKQHVEGAIVLGADAITMPIEVFEQMTQDSLTQAGIEKFKLDWEKGPHGQLLE